MAKSKKTRRAQTSTTTKPQTKTKPKTTEKSRKSESAAAPKAAAVSAIEPAEQVAFVRLRLTLPSVTPDELAAYRARFSDEECTETGAQTRATEVLAQARRVALNVAPRVLANTDALRYATTRFSYFMDCIDELEPHVLAQSEGRKGGQLRRGTLVTAEAETKASLEEARSVFDDALGGALRDQFVTTAERASAQAEPHEALALWAKLGRDLLTGGDKHAAATLAGHMVSDSLLTRWERVALDHKRLQQSAQEAPVVARDLPATNRAEGRVLLEASLLYNAFLRAKARGADVALPAFGPALLRVAKPGSRATGGAKKGAAAKPAKEEPKKTDAKKDEGASADKKG